MEKTTLEVGDKVYAYQYRQLVGVYTVTRLTPTTVIAKRETNDRYLSSEVRLKRIIEPNGFVREIGGTSNSTSFWLETPELKARFQLKQAATALQTRLGSLNISKLTMEQIQAISAQLDTILTAETA